MLAGAAVTGANVNAGEARNKCSTYDTVLPTTIVVEVSFGLSRLNQVYQQRSEMAVARSGRCRVPTKKGLRMQPFLVT